jgi:hypothetical protein
MTFPTVVVRTIVFQVIGLKMLAKLLEGRPVCSLLQVIWFTLPEVTWTASPSDCCRLR